MEGCSKCQAELAERLKVEGHLRRELEELAQAALIIMVLDLEYSNELRPVHGHTPIRHQLLWERIQDILGEKEMQCAVGRLEEAAKKGNFPVKTNPWKDKTYAEKCRDKE